jgi:hypothetical protein
MTIRQGDKIVAGSVVNHDYLELENKPVINNIVLRGSFTLEDLGIQPAGDYLKRDEYLSYINTSTESLDTLYNNLLTALNKNSLDIKHFIHTVKNELEEYAKKEDLYKVKEDCSDYTNLRNTPDLKILDQYATKDLLNEFITRDDFSKALSQLDLSEYCKKEELSKLQSITSENNYITKEQLDVILKRYMLENDFELRLADELNNISSEENYVELNQKNKKRQERDDKLNAVIWRIERYEQQLKLGIETLDTEKTYYGLLQYVQYLRDIPQQDAFPNINILTFEEYLTTI